MAAPSRGCRRRCRSGRRSRSASPCPAPTASTMVGASRARRIASRIRGRRAAGPWSGTGSRRCRSRASGRGSRRRSPATRPPPGSRCRTGRRCRRRGRPPSPPRSSGTTRKRTWSTSGVLSPDDAGARLGAGGVGLELVEAARRTARGSRRLNLNGPVPIGAIHAPSGPVEGRGGRCRPAPQSSRARVGQEQRARLVEAEDDGRGSGVSTPSTFSPFSPSNSGRQRQWSRGVM